MPSVPADLCIEARWIVPMSARDDVLENHAVVVRDGRILALLPAAEAATRYAAAAVMRRPSHLLMPGLVNAHTSAATALFRAARPPIAAFERRWAGAEFVRDGVLAAIAEMLRAGITCFADRYPHPEETARAAREQGVRAVIGLPVSADRLTEALGVRDEYGGHPLISTVFAPQPVGEVGDAEFARIATLADELDAGIIIDLHASAAEVEASLRLHGMRPIERLWQLGLLTPALHAVHMAYASPADIELARRTGISISIESSTSFSRDQHPWTPASLLADGFRLGCGTGSTERSNQDLWPEIRLFARLTPGLGAWDALALATRGGAAVLGLDGEIGTLESGKWADLCCVDLSGPSVQPIGDPVAQLVFCGGRDIVSDVWVAGRQLLSNRDLTRLDWSGVAARAMGWAARMSMGD
jgi:5-methylthioadenosine/S-adenosylhomocysteine deaminase